MESNDLTFILTLEAGQILYIHHHFALGSVQLRIFFFFYSKVCVHVSICPRGLIWLLQVPKGPS